MSQANKMFNLGSVFILGIVIFGHAIHWFITPIAHPAASQASTAAAAAQAVVGVIVAIYAWIRRKRELAAG